MRMHSYPPLESRRGWEKKHSRTIATIWEAEACSVFDVLPVVCCGWSGHGSRSILLQHKLGWAHWRACCSDLERFVDGRGYGRRTHWYAICVNLC